MANQEVNYFLSLDLGITTGYARFSWDSDESHLHGTIPYDTFVHDLMLLITEWPISDVVVEKPVVIRGQLGDKMQNLIRWTHELCGEVWEVAPSQWKPHPTSRMPLPDYMTVHEKDAVRLGVWWRNSRLQGQA